MNNGEGEIPSKLCVARGGVAMKYIDELLKSLYVMASMVEARDPYTGGHLWRVSQVSQLLALPVGPSRRGV